MDTLITQQKVLGPLSDEHTPFSNCRSLCSLKLKPASCIWSTEGFFSGFSAQMCVEKA